MIFKKSILIFILFLIIFINNVNGQCQISEVEPNNDFTNSEYLDMQRCLNSAEGINIKGKISPTGDVDIFKIKGPFSPGYAFGVFFSALDNLRGVSGVFYEGLQTGETLIITYHSRDLSLRENYQYLYLAVTNTPGDSGVGDYKLEIRKVQAEIPNIRPQKVLLDFDGASNVEIGSRLPIDVPPLENSWLANEYPGQLGEIKRIITEKIKEDYAGFNVEIYTTDGNIPQEPYSTVYFGGSSSSENLGLVDDIDNYNSVLTDEAIVYIEKFQAFQPLNPSLNEISQVIANIASHEIGHLLGLVHTADPVDIMDRSAGLSQMLQNQQFSNSFLHHDIFPLGKQNSLHLLGLIVGALYCTDKDDKDYPPGTELPSAESILTGSSNGVTFSSATGILKYDYCDVSDKNYIYEAICFVTGLNQYYRARCPNGYACFDAEISNRGDYCRLSRSCLDSDSSLNPPVSSDTSLKTKGIVEFWQLTGGQETTQLYQDNCVSGTQVREYYCTSEFDYSSVGVNCPAGKICNNGKCENPMLSCEDECSCERGSGLLCAGCNGNTERWSCGEANDGDACKDRIYSFCGSGKSCERIPPNPKGICMAANWASSASYGENVGLTVGPCADCIGKLINFEVFENKFNDPALTKPLSTAFQSDGFATTSWNVERIEDISNPEFYFNAKLDENPNVTVLSNALTIGALCGNNIIEGNEQCDGSLNGQTCQSLGFTGGKLYCGSVGSILACKFDTGRCYICGNGILESGEVCDDGNILTCSPYPGCSANCQREVKCGNRIKECNEQCDDGNLINGDGCSSSCRITSGGGGTGSFLPGTKILMSDNSLKNIEDIKVGELVKSYDENKKEIVNAKVTAILSHEMPGYYTINDHLKITETNPIWANNGWTYPGSLEIGDELLGVDDTEMFVDNIKYIEEEVVVYNLQIEPTNTYFASGINVHNQEQIVKSIAVITK